VRCLAHPAAVERCRGRVQRRHGVVAERAVRFCSFEVAMYREKYPEKIPFRLTRMLIRAMEAHHFLSLSLALSLSLSLSLSLCWMFDV
jgi:hypothetical protein